MAFTHLHVHSHYSLLDGLPKIEELLDQAKELGFSSLALTDHGVMYGAVEFYNYAKEIGIKPIIGFEAYIAPRSLSDKETKIDNDYFHLTLLAKNYAGYKNLMKLTTIAHLEGFYYKPRLDKKTLAAHAEGVIALSGCQRGEIYRALKNGNQAAADKALQEYLQIFGEENFYLEIQRNQDQLDPHNEKVIAALAKMAQVHGLSLVATGDVHYLKKEDVEAQDVLICIGTGRNVGDQDRLNMTAYDVSMKSAEKMAELFSDHPEAVGNTAKIAERCELEIPTNQRYFPVYKTPENKSPEDYLREITFERALKFYGQNNTLPQHVTDRLNYELEIITKKGFATYFLVLADIVNFAKDAKIITNTRGSAAGSMVGYVIGITNVDPLYFQLPFERFLTMHRPTPPDIDLDIADTGRDRVIEYVTAEYGKEKVAQIITFGTMMARAAVRDVGRALGVSYSKCDRIAKMIPIGKQGFHINIDKALEISSELKEVYEKDPETQKIIDIARKVEGNARHASVHAAGIVITPTELTDYMPLQKEPDGEKIITQYDMYSLDVNAKSDAIGAVKIDLLGIRNLSILEECIRIVEARHHTVIDIYNLPQPDKKTFEMLAAGHTFGVFQLGGSGMTRYIKELKPKHILDIMVMIALYRPGPMENIPDYIARSHNPSLTRYLDPSLEPILKRSYGVLVYQDDLLQIAHDIAGYTWEEVDKFRKAVGKKIPAEMQKQKEKFISGCVNHSKLRPDRAEEIWTLFTPFAAYGFNKSHAASYSTVSYQTAYMKANYTVEFMAAVMTAESGDVAKIYEAVEECKKMGINVLPPDVNESLRDFTVIDEHNIRFGLGAVKNLGHDVVTKIKDERRLGGKFKNLKDFVLRTQTKNLNKKSWEALVKCGALDAFGERNQLLANTESILELARSDMKSKASGQESLFGSQLESAEIRLMEAVPATKEEKLAWEKELLGLYVSSHPLENYQKVLKQLLPIGSLREEMIDANIQIGGIISKLKKSLTKKNEPMVFLTIEDQTGTIEAIVFPKVLEKVRHLVEEEQVIQASGRLSDKDDEFKLIIDDIKELPLDIIYEDRIADIARKSVVAINLPEKVSKDTLAKLKTILEKYPGNAAVNLVITSGPGAEKTLPTKIQVAFSDDLVYELREIKEVQRVRVLSQT